MGNVGLRWNAVGWLVGWFGMGLNFSAKYLHWSPILLCWSPIILDLSPGRKKSSIVIVCFGLVTQFFFVIGKACFRTCFTTTKVL